MKVCVVGGGGREHALAHVLGRSCDVVVTPGNPGIAGSTPAPPNEIEADLYVIGPEAPLVHGLADELRASGCPVFGPGADGARLEGSKAWMKELLVAAGVPTAGHGSFTEPGEAIRFLDGMGDLFVIKTDGLAAGKGVLVTEDRGEAVDAVRSYLSGQAFGDAGRRVVIEEGLTGPELSVLAVCDGRHAVPLAPAQDFKRIGEGDTGPNTGGMGAYSPVPVAGDEVVAEVMDRAVLPTLAELRRRGIDYRGVLYAGLMLTPQGMKVLEYNVRFGDPEAQVVLPRLRSDLADLLAGAAAGVLGEPPVYGDDAAVTVVCAAEGYPASPRTGDIITGIDAAGAEEGVTVFCAGVSSMPGGGVTGGAPSGAGQSMLSQSMLTAGGRVLTVTGQGPDLVTARNRAYAGIAHIRWPGRYVRFDIAAAAVDSLASGGVG
ncbi:phosphoribosylamine--glycine ligase [Candidatus Poriferisocius sp.]|uniref:phosphoribosylamine--glycine ligase n=1 Tax=Candidatus Poriferisocius sp. TaxID=3101276 RepID=UPI003B0141E7